MSVVWLFDLDNTLHDASHAAFAPTSAAMSDYIVRHLGVSADEAHALRRAYWLRYGATLLGLVRHHGVRAAHFLEETHRLPGLEARLRTSAHDRAALAALPGRKVILTNAPRAYAMRVLDALRLTRAFDAIVTIEDMTMFGQHRPKPDARMLRRLCARLKVRAEPLRAGRGHARAPEGGAPGRHARGLDAALPRRAFSRPGVAALRRRDRTPRRAAAAIEQGAPPGREAGVRVCQNPVAPRAALPAMTPPADLPAAGSGDDDAASLPPGELAAADTSSVEPAPVSGLAGADPLAVVMAPLPAPARKRPRPGERRVQILQTLGAMLEQPGAERITTAALAARLAVSEAALYRHFASKAQMFEALVEFIEQGVWSAIEPIARREPDPSKQARQVVDALLQFAEGNPGLARVMVADALLLESERLVLRMNQFFDRIEAELRRSLQARLEAIGVASAATEAQVKASALTAFAIGRLQRFARSGLAHRPSEHLDRALDLFTA